MSSNQPPIIMTGDVGDDVFYNREGISNNSITITDFNDTGDRISLIYNRSGAIRSGQRQYTYTIQGNIIYQEIHEVKHFGFDQIQAQRKDVEVYGSRRGEVNHTELNLVPHIKIKMKLIIDMLH